MYLAAGLPQFWSITLQGAFHFAWNEFMFALLLEWRDGHTLTNIVPNLVGGHEILWQETANVLSILRLHIYLRERKIAFSKGHASNPRAKRLVPKP